MGEPSGSPSGQQCLETKLTKMLEQVKPPDMYEHDKQCIYRVPQSLRETNPKAYTPRIVSIGPFHHKVAEVDKEDNILKSMEELKLKYLKGFLNRKRLRIGHFVDKLKGLEETIRSFYAEPITYNSDDFTKMILVDACFIIEHFLRWHRYPFWEKEDPLLQKPWMIIDIVRDLILLENQLPFFVLQALYDLSGMNHEFPPFLTITFNYLKNINPGKDFPREPPKHFTDLLRASIVPSSTFHLGILGKYTKIEHLYSASQLSGAVSLPLLFLIVVTVTITSVAWEQMLRPWWIQVRDDEVVLP
ncbi:UPF0481 protein [Spatholobus suberectus]|nr:UPF0481 protein [Spatholobus suberectus]